MRSLDQLSQLSEEEIQLLEANKEFFQRESQTFADQFYRYVEETPELVSIIQKHSTIERIKEVQKHFFESLFEAEVSEVRREYIYQIGQVHYRIGLESYWIIKFMNVFLSYIETHGKDLGEAFLAAVRKSLRFREELIIQSYNDIYRKSEQRILYQAFHDPLTSLPNRYFLETKLPQSIARARRNGTLLAVCIIDLDDFKPVNDMYGHDAGDLLLKEFSKRMQTRLREEDSIARLGGDEFVVVLEGFDDKEFLQQLPIVFNRLHEAVETAFELGSGSKAEVGMSLGCAIYPIDGEDGSALITQADKALNLIKTRKKDRDLWWQFGSIGSPIETANKGEFDPYGIEAAELLNTIQDFLDTVGGEFVDTFYKDIIKLPGAQSIISNLSNEEMNTLIIRQTEHLRLLLSPGTKKEMILERAEFLGRLHVLTGVNFVLLTLSLILYRNILNQLIAKSLVPRRKHHQLLLIIENRLLDDILFEIQMGETVIGNYLKVQSRYIGGNILNLEGAVNEEINLLGSLPGIISAVFIRLNSQSTFVIEHSAGPRATDIATVLNKPEALIGQSMIANSWHSRKINSFANFQRDQSNHFLLEMAKKTGIRSSIIIPIINQFDNQVGIIVLYGAYFNQFESSWMQNFAHNLQMSWKTIR